MRVLALGAHPDDLEIYAWGSLCAWVKMGAQVTLAVATDGAAGGAEPPAALARRRKAEACAAAAGLRAEPRFLGFPDGALQPDAALVGAVKHLVRELCPDLIVTHAPNDYHADHRSLAQAVSQAAGFSAPVLSMDTMNGTGFVPTCWVDVTEHWSAKMTAIRAHASQDPERFVVSAARQGAYRSGEANGAPETYAEAFRFDARFPFADIRALLPPPPAIRPVSSRSRAADSDSTS